MRSAIFWVITQRIVNLEEGIDRLSRNICNECHYALRNNPEERRSHLFREGSLKSSHKNL